MGSLDGAACTGLSILAILLWQVYYNLVHPLCYRMPNVVFLLTFYLDLYCKLLEMSLIQVISFFAQSETLETVSLTVCTG